MAANPRKFSEKIALMRAKEAEGDAAFHQILNEVSGITKTPESTITSTHIPAYPGVRPLSSHVPPYTPFKTGSLPNINHSLQQQQIQHHHHQFSGNQSITPHASNSNHLVGSGIDLKSAIHDLNSLNGGESTRRRFISPHYNGPMGVRPQRSRTTDHSSYSPYLTPHPLNGPEWKKFKSDSDIHGSMKQHPPSTSTGSSPSSGVISPMIHRRVLEVGGNGNLAAHDVRSNNSSTIKFPETFTSNGLPARLPIVVPHPISMPMQHQHHGSLPDLSNLGFNNSTNSSSSQGPCSPPGDGYGRMVSTSMPPPDSPSSMRSNGNRQQSPLVGSPTQLKALQGIHQHFQYFPQPMLPSHNSVIQPHSCPVPPPAHLHNTEMTPQSIPAPPSQTQNKQTNLEKQLVNETIRRRISDKMLAQQAQQYRQTSESLPSPSSPIRSPESVSGLSQQGESQTSTMSYVLSPGSHSLLQQQFTDQVKMENPYVNGSMSDSHLINECRHPVKQHSIPNIILTGTDENSGQYYEREWRQNMNFTESFDANEMFGSDDQFKTDLTPLDMEELQMLEDPTNVLTDPSSEDQLRL